MTLDEAIEHAKEVARTCDDKACAAEHEQLAEWLSLLKVYTDTHMAKEVQRARHEMHGWQLEWKREMERRKELEDESAKLRDELAKWEQLVVGIDLPEYPVTQFKPKDLERENAKLSELAKAVRDFLGDINCDGCQYRHDCDDNNIMFCGDDLSYHAFQTIRELGIEEDD